MTILAQNDIKGLMKLILHFPMGANCVQVGLGICVQTTEENPCFPTGVSFDGALIGDTDSDKFGKVEV